jgi:DNA modification methylase
MIKGTPRYQLYNVDAFKWLRRRRVQSIHAVVTDPPFGLVEYQPAELKKMRDGTGGIWRLPNSFDGNIRRPTPRFTVLTREDHAKIASFHERLSALVFRVLVPGGHVVIASQNLFCHFVSTAFYNAGFEIRGQIARIVKTLRGGDRPKGAHRRFPEISVSPRCSWEPWLIFRKPCDDLVRNNLEKWGTGALRRPSKDTPFRDLIPSRTASCEERAVVSHPSLKPHSFMVQIVRAVLPCERGIVLDPFMGSGSTIAAAEALHFHSIGLEISRSFFALARRSIPARIEMLQQDPLFQTANGQAESRNGNR